MKTEDQLTAQQSLDIITSMIREAKGNVQRNGFYFLLWGWIVVIANLGMFVLMQMNYPYPYIVWSITVPAWVWSIVRGFRHEKVARTTTHLDKVTGWLWVCFGITVFTLVAFGRHINWSLNPVILTVSAIPAFVSGAIIRFKPLMLGGAAFWVFGIISFLVPANVQPLVGAVAVLCGYLVPGYLLNSKR